MALIGSTFKTKTDSYDLLADPDQDVIEVRSDIHSSIWAEASTPRQSGALVALGNAIHGDYDPHPITGIREPLAPVLVDFRIEILERYARDAFFDLLRREI